NDDIQKEQGVLCAASTRAVLRGGRGAGLLENPRGRHYRRGSVRQRGEGLGDAGNGRDGASRLLPHTLVGSGGAKGAGEGHGGPQRGTGRGSAEISSGCTEKVAESSDGPLCNGAISGEARKFAGSAAILGEVAVV